MKTSKEIERLRKQNANLYKRFEALKAELETEKNNSSDIYKKEEKYIKSLESLFNDMSNLYEEIAVIRKEYKENLDKLKMFRYMMTDGKIPSSFTMRVKDFMKRKR